MLYNKQEEMFYTISGQLFWCLTTIHCEFFPHYIELEYSLLQLGLLQWVMEGPKLYFYLFAFQAH